MPSRQHNRALTAASLTVCVCVCVCCLASPTQDNLIRGRFLAELTCEVFNDLENSKYQHAEMRISIYGRKQARAGGRARCRRRRALLLCGAAVAAGEAARSMLGTALSLMHNARATQVEWDILAAWVVANNLASDNVVWLIQIPRLYNVYRDQGIIENFEQARAALCVVCCVLCVLSLTHCHTTASALSLSLLSLSSLSHTHSPQRCLALSASHSVVPAPAPRCWRTSSCRCLRSPSTPPATRSCTASCHR